MTDTSDMGESIYITTHDEQGRMHVRPYISPDENTTGRQAMTGTSARYIDPEIDRTLDALTSRHPAIEAHERFIRDRLAELAYRAYQHGEHVALSTLISPSDAQRMLGVSSSQLSYLARKHDVGWNTGSGHRVYRPADIEALRQIRRDNPPGYYDRSQLRKT
jgi:hypothetical protein